MRVIELARRHRPDRPPSSRAALFIVGEHLIYLVREAENVLTCNEGQGWGEGFQLRRCGGGTIPTQQSEGPGANARLRQFFSWVCVLRLSVVVGLD